MREQDHVRLRALNHLPQRQRKSIRRVFLEQLVLDQQHLIELIPRQLISKPCDAFTHNHARKRPLRLLRNLLCRRQRLKADLVPLPFALLGN